MNFLIKPTIGIFINGATLYAVTRLVDEITYTGGIKFFVLGGVILGVINFIIKPILTILSAPLAFLFGGIIYVAVNMLLLWLLSYIFDVLKFQDVTLTFPNFSTYVIGAIVFGIINWIIHLIFK